MCATKPNNKVSSLKKAARNIPLTDKFYTLLLILCVSVGLQFEGGFDLVVNQIVPVAQAAGKEINANLEEWQLPPYAASPKSGQMDEKKVALGKMLFFDPRLSGNGKMSCASCHDPKSGWSDGLPTARGHNNKVLERATPSIINVGFNKILMWDGRENSLEDQAMAPITNPNEMNNTVRNLIQTLKRIPGYVKAYKEAFWGLNISETGLRSAIAMYQRRVVAQDSPFDRWIDGDAYALSNSEIEGFRIFTDPMRGNCMVCHRPPNFTDNGFHNIGLASFNVSNPDLGRHNVKPVSMTRGAFKTPPLRNIAETKPYFHDGSAKNLMEVVDHYATKLKITETTSPNLRKITLSDKDKQNLVAFLKSLTGKIDPALSQVSLPK